MSDGKLGYRVCYICHAVLDPLVSNCPECGYSQLPKDLKGDKTGSLKQVQQDRRANLRSKLDQAKAGYTSRLKKK